MIHDLSRKNVRAEIDKTLSVLNLPYVDIFVPARVDHATPIEETMAELKALVQEGKVKSVGLSEASAHSIRRASRVHPVACLQTEYGPMERDAESNGIFDACRENDVTVLAYGVVQHGFISSRGLGPWESFRDDASRKFYPRFHKENYEHNQKFLHLLQAFIERKRLPVTISQLAVASVMQRGYRAQKQGKEKADTPVVVPLLGMRSLASLEDNAKAADFAANMSQPDVEELETVIRGFEIRGNRYPPQVMTSVNV